MCWRGNLQYCNEPRVQKLIESSYLWPGYNDDASNHHVLLIVLISNVRSQEHLPIWSKQLVLDPNN